MRRTSTHWLILYSISLCRVLTVPAAAEEVSPLGGFTSRIQASIEESGPLRCRVSAACDTGVGEVGAFVDEDCSPAGIELSGFGLTSRGCDLGPLREAGLLSALNHPAGIGSIIERSGASLDRSLDPGSLKGGVIRFHGPLSSHQVVELYGAARGGLAPDGTKTGGAFLTSGLGSHLSLDVGSKVTLFGSHDEEEDEWLLAAPDANPPSIFRAGSRLAYRGRQASAAVSAGAAFSDGLRPSSFVTGSFGFSGNLPAGIRASYSARLDAGVVDPDYIGDDGRYPTRTVLLHPVVSLRLPGMSFMSWYRCDLYRLPVLPVACRRVVHSGSVAGEVRFGQLSVGAGLKPLLDFAADGRTIYRVQCNPRARLSVGSVSLETVLELTRSNLEEPRVGAHLGARGQWQRGMAGVSVDIDEGKGRLKAEGALVGKRWQLSAAFAVPDVVSVDFGAPRVSLNGLAPDALERASCSVSFELRP